MAIHQANTAMPQPSDFCASPAVFRVDIPLLNESAVGNALQFIDLLCSANILADLRMGSGAPQLTWRLLDAQGLPLPPLSGPLARYQGKCLKPESGAACALFIPSLHVPDIPTVRRLVTQHPGLVRQIGAALDAGHTLLTLGNGAWLAAACGRLNGRQTSLPWFYVMGFARDFPAIGIASAQTVVEDGPWISAALPHSLSELAIALVHRTLGHDLAQACTIALASDPERTRAVLQAEVQQHIPLTRESTLARAMAWMQEHLEEPYSLPRLAQAAAVSARTLLRHFQQELSQSPLEHLHHLRCARAKVLLEVTLESVPSIALACGYSDPAAFRRIFVRHTGMAPSAYRTLHALRAPRRRWQVDVNAR